MTSAAEDSETAGLLAQEAVHGYGWKWRVTCAGNTSHTIELRSVAPPARGPALFAQQGYELDVTRERIVVEGATAQGRFYGVQTLRQLFRAHPDGAIPCLHIKDYPALAWRGISDDISRGQVSTIEDFKDIIQQLAYYKINLYQVYIEDMFLFTSSRTSGEVRGALSSSELAQLVKEGRRNHVVVSPIFETLAHQERMLSLEEHRQFAADGEQGRGTAPRNAWTKALVAARLFLGRFAVPRSGGAASPASFSANDPQASRFVQTLVDEIATITRGPFFHIGGDEWQPPATSVGAVGASDQDGVRAYGRYLGPIAHHLAARYGCRAMVYSDVILEYPEAAQELPRDVVIVDWHYDPQDSFPSLRQLTSLGFYDVMVSPGLWTWRTFYPNYASGFQNVATFAQAGKRQGAMGCITATWGDGGAENLRENNWAGYAFTAAAAWEPDVPATDPFLRRFVAAHYGVDCPELARAEKLLGWQKFEHTPWVGRLYHGPLLVRPRSDSSVERLKALEADMQQVEKDLDIAEGVVRVNQPHLATARHCARRYRYMAERELMLDGIGRSLEGRTAARLSPAERARIVGEFGRLETTASALQGEFSRLWLRHNRPEGLAENEARLAKQGTMLQRLRELAGLGLLSVDDTFSNIQAVRGAP